MKKIYKLLRSCVTALAVFTALNGYAQDSTIKGRVVSEDSPDGLPGVSVLIKGTSTGTVTDIDGNYTIATSAGDVLTFSFIGYEMQEVPVAGRSSIDVSLDFDVKGLEEVVVIGYGEQDKRDITGSIVSVKADQLAQATPVSALEGMRGRLAGVSITANGAPGEAADISIRGTSTLNSGTGPLYVVDGQQMDNIENINPSDIESIEVLKDGASAAIYGSKSANGVIILTTKKGKAGKTKIDASYVRSYTSLASKIPVSNTRQARQYELARSASSGDPQNAPTPPDSLSQLFNQDFDYQEIISRIGIRDQVGLSLSGGSENASFYWNSGFLDQQGVIKNSNYQRFNSTLNLTFKVANRINAGTRFNLSYAERNGLNEGSVFGQLSTHFPFLPFQDNDGTFVAQTSSQQNIVAETIFTVRERRDYDGQIFNYLEFELAPSLKFRSTLGIIMELQKNTDFNPTIVQRIGQAASGSENTLVNTSLQHENFLTWTKSYGDHNISALGGMQIQTWQNEFSRLESITFNNDIVSTFNNVGELVLGSNDTRTTASSHSLVSQYARVSYDYKGKYLFSATLRRDGSSRFGSANQYGRFPAASIGWRISDEFFMAPLANVVSDLKLRASWARNGNERIPSNLSNGNLADGNFAPLTLFAPGRLYDGVNGIGANQLGNQSLQWEETTQINYGVDLGLFNGRFNATVDFYTKMTDELLYGIQLAPETGWDQVNNNIGSIQNSGIEIFLSGTPIDLGDFQWFTSFNISTNQNEILDLAEDDGEFIADRHIFREGGSIGDIYGYTQKGVFAYDESNAFDDEGNQLTPIFNEGVFEKYQLNGVDYTGNINQLMSQGQVLQGGNVIWEDHNDDFIIDANNDRTIIGNALPEFFGGFYNEFKYKGLKLSVLVDYNFGNDLYRAYDETRNQRMVRTVLPGPDRIDNAWYQQGDESFYGTLVTDSKNNLRTNTYWLDDADFIKLRSVRLDYKLPQTIVERAKILSDVSVYISGNNLLTWTNYEGYNPELGSRGAATRPGVDNLRYPNSREYILGLNISF